MAPPPVFKGLRLQWLMSNLPGYEEAIKAGQGADFLCELVKRFVRRFPATLFPENEEPTEEWMAKDESELPPKEELVEPRRRPGQSMEDHLKEVEAFQQLAENEVTTVMQVKNFMRRRVANGVFSFEKGGEAWNLVMAKLAGIPLGKPGRQRTAFNVWAKQNEALIDALVERKRQELLEEKKRLSKDSAVHVENSEEGPKCSTEGDGESKDESLDKYSVSLRQSVVKSEFEKLSEQEQEKWRALAKEEHAQRKMEYQQLLEAGYSEDPVKRQAAIDRFPVWIMEVLQEASKATGLHMSLFAGGPIPSAGGELKIIGYST
ncbi:SERTA domain-containing protein 3 [Marasmius crinis-equi]|uniref:SERTA domain-containing protein 3 n=1 Tax=Marasmius crinis-equi TaxID=585013 RepID=A0ABR3EK34_9AGAR